MLKGDTNGETGNANMQYAEQQNERTSQHHDETSDTYEISKRIYRISLFVLVFLVTGLFGLAYLLMESSTENAELKTTLSLAEQKLDHSDKKSYEQAESLDVVMGVLLNNKGMIIRSETSNPLRRGTTYGSPHRFTFARWSETWRGELLKTAYLLESYEVLSHIASIDGWDEGLSDKLVNKVVGKLQFIEVLDSAPSSTQQTWSRFADSIRRDEEQTVKFAEKEYLKKGRNPEGGKNAFNISK